MAIINDLRAGAKAVLDGIPSLVSTYTARPASIGSLPSAWVEEIRVDLLHTAGVRQWSGELDVLLVCGGFDNEESQGHADAYIEAIIDAFTDSPHMAGANTVSEPLRARSTSVDNGNGVTYPAWIITVGKFVYAEGR